MKPLEFFEQKPLITYDLSLLYKATVEDLTSQNAVFFTPEALLEKFLSHKGFVEYSKEYNVNLDDMKEELNLYTSMQDLLLGTKINDLIPTKFMKEITNRLIHLQLKKFVAKEPVDFSKYRVNIFNVFYEMFKQNDSMVQYMICKYFGKDPGRWFDTLYKFFKLYEVLEEPEEEAKEEPKGTMPSPKFTMSTTAIVNGKMVNVEGMLPPELLKKMVEDAANIAQSIKEKLSNGATNGNGISGSIIDINEMSGNNNEDDTKFINDNSNTEEQKSLLDNIMKPIHMIWRLKPDVIGREKEIERAIRILCRKDKHNPIFVGEPGVGKTALIYGIARELEKCSAPGHLMDSKIYELDMGAMLAGTSLHGEFERRVKTVLDEARKQGDCIIYIDDIHSIGSVGGGQGNGTMSAADLFKPYLDNERIRIIGSTTYKNYNKSIANNKTLARRFSLVDVKEPSVEEAIKMVKGVIHEYEFYHDVKYKPDAIRYAVKQSAALIADRYLPAKAFEILDEAGAYLKQHPLLNKQGKRKAGRYQIIDEDIINKVMTEVCRIDAKALASTDNESLRDLDKRMRNEIYGQDDAIRQLTRSVMMSKAGLSDPNKPMASLLFVGPTGVGKTEVCRVLAKELGIELIRFDMSEYTEKHTVSKLIGSPAGYIGYDEGGLLTDAMRKTPNCVLLFDEIEKAHSDIYNILLQVMDYAKLTDNKGNKADFRNVILVMTSNAGAQYAGQASIGFSGGTSRGEAMMATVKKTFKPEFINRLSGTIVFNDMDEHMASLILDKKLRQLADRLKEKGVAANLKPEAYKLLLEKGFTKLYGAREMDRTINQYLTPLLMEEILFGKLAKGGEVTITRNGDKLEIDR